MVLIGEKGLKFSIQAILFQSLSVMVLCGVFKNLVRQITGLKRVGSGTKKMKSRFWNKTSSCQSKKTLAEISVGLTGRQWSKTCVIGSQEVIPRQKYQCFRVAKLKFKALNSCEFTIRYTDLNSLQDAVFLPPNLLKKSPGVKNQIWVTNLWSSSLAVVL